MNWEIEKIFLTDEFDPVREKDPSNTHTDVIVQFKTKEKFIASFFTFQNIAYLQKENMRKGDFINGKYFWKKNMVLIDTCTKEQVGTVIRHLISEGDFQLVFQKLT